MIRKATPADIDAIVDFQIKMALETEDLQLDSEVLYQGVQALFKNPEKGQYFVAEADGKVVGSTLTTYEWSDWRNATIIWLQSVYILPSYRNQKIFSKIYNHIRKIIEEDDSFCGLRLYVDKSNKHAQKVYKTLGMDGDHYDTYEWFK